MKIMKGISLLILSLCILTAFGSEFLIIYPGAVAIKGDNVSVNADQYQLEVPESWLTDSFTSKPYPNAYRHVVVQPYNYAETLKKAVGSTIKWRFQDGTIKPYDLLLDDPILLSDSSGIFTPTEGTAVFEEISIEQSGQYLDLSFQEYVESLTYSYLFTNLSYKTFYVMSLNEDKNEVEIVGTLLIKNTTKRDIATNNLYIFSGEINTVSTDYALKAMRSFNAEADMYSGGSTMENFDDYKIYCIPGSFSFERSSTDYINFLQSREQYEKIYTFNAYYSNRNSDFEPFDQTIRISKLSKALMAGKIRLQERDSVKSVFLGENNINNASKGQALEISFGKAYDLQGKLELIQSNRSGNTYFEAYKFTAKNYSSETKAIQLNFTLPRDSDVEVDVYDYSRPTATLLQIPLTLHKDMEAEVTFEIRYDR